MDSTVEQLSRLLAPKPKTQAPPTPMMQDFYVSLPSNTSAEDLANRQNTSSKFRVRLPQEIELGSDAWEVALVEFQYPRSWYNVSDEPYLTVKDTTVSQNEMILQLRAGLVAHAGKAAPRDLFRRVTIPPSYYAEVDMLTAAIYAQLLNDDLGEFDGQDRRLADEISFQFDPIKQKVVFQFHNVPDRQIVAVKMSEQLQYVMGFETDYLTENKIMVIAKYPPDMRAGIDSLFVYCDVIAPQIVGNRQEQLLRIVPVSGRHGAIVDRVFVAPHYVPVLNKRFSTIGISINTDQDRPFAFKFGKSVVKLHFRKQRALRL